MCAFKSLRPYIVEGARVSFIMSAGDVLAQTVADKSPLKELDVMRTVKFASLGLVLVGPALRLWYGYMDKVVSPKQPPWKRACKKMCMDQFLFSPVFTMVFTGLVATMNGDTPEKLKIRLKTDYITIMEKNYMLWPAAQVINFTLVPIQYQILFCQIIGIFWNYYISAILHKDS